MDRINLVHPENPVKLTEQLLYDLVALLQRCREVLRLIAATFGHVGFATATTANDRRQFLDDFPAGTFAVKSADVRTISETFPSLLRPSTTTPDLMRASSVSESCRMAAASSPLASRARTLIPATSRDSSPFAEDPVAPLAIFNRNSSASRRAFFNSSCKRETALVNSLREVLNPPLSPSTRTSASRNLS